MNNSDIFEYINSKDIKKYLREKDYQFTAAEAAWLIEGCARINLTEKQSALKDLMKSMPDPKADEVPSKVFCIESENKSLFSLIKRYIKAQNELLKRFFNKEDGGVYILGAYYAPDKVVNCIMHGNPDYGEPAYSETDSSRSKTYSSFEKLLEEETQDYEEIKRIKVCKKYLDADYQIEMTADKIGTPLSISYMKFNDVIFPETEILWLFENMWFNFPVPFKRGDVVCLPELPNEMHSGLENEPFVLISTSYGEELYKQPIYPMLDSTDMYADGYFIDDYGLIYKEGCSCLMDLEYYRGEFKGAYRTLPLLSEAMKSKKPDYQRLLNGYIHYTLDRGAKAADPDYYKNLIAEKANSAGNGQAHE